MAPVDDLHTVLDWMAALNPRVVLVAGGYVGTISHTLTALDVLRRRSLDPVAIVVSESGAGDDPPLAETLDVLTRLTLPSAPLLGLPHVGAEAAGDDPAIRRVLDFLGAARPERQSGAKPL
jgi:dethiobiotin synthetase